MLWQGREGGRADQTRSSQATPDITSAISRTDLLAGCYLAGWHCKLILGVQVDWWGWFDRHGCRFHIRSCKQLLWSVHVDMRCGADQFLIR